MNRILAVCLVVVLAVLSASGDTLAGKAAYGGNEIRLYTEPLAYEVLHRDKVAIAKTPIGLTLDGAEVAPKGSPNVTKRRLAGKVATSVYKKSAIDLSGSESLVDFGDWAVRLCARKDGAAYRFELKKAATVDAEKASFTLPYRNASCWYGRSRQIGCEEAILERSFADRLKNEPKKFAFPPFVYEYKGLVVAVTESDVVDYPIWNFDNVHDVENGIRYDAKFRNYPKHQFHTGARRQNPEKGGRWVVADKDEPYLVKADAPRALPWRAFVLADSFGALCEADLVFALARPQAKGDFSWVMPGKVAWDWWNCFDNGAGCNTKTYERFIDFASKNGVEYVIFDEGWSADLDIWKLSPKVDVPHLIDYAAKRKVGIILWMAWAQVYGNEEKVASHFAKLGAKGFKVDFMDRGDADCVHFIEKFAAACAKNRMLVDYHGMYRPVGLTRRYPNVVNYEGVHGLEQMKGYHGQDIVNSDVKAFYTRFTAGSADYTPGAMLNYPIGGYKGGGNKPGSLGTRVRQMAMMTLFEAPLQMLCDSPTNYEKNMESFGYMVKVPTVWAKTVSIGGSPDTVAACARKSRNGVWYAAGIGTERAQDFSFGTAFLGSGEWTAEIFRDAEDSDREATHFVHETRKISAGEKLTFHLAPGGGFTVRFQPAAISPRFRA